MPIDWLDQLKREYPKRSGPMSWPRVFLKVRHALLETCWDDCIAGVKRYAKYCQEAGLEGSAFVVSPARFFEDEIYLESLTFQAAEDPKVSEHKRKEAERLGRVEREGIQYGLERYQLESVGAFETRIMLERTQGPVHRHAGANISAEPQIAGANQLAESVSVRPMRSSMEPGTSNGDGTGMRANVSGRVAELAARMRIAK